MVFFGACGYEMCTLDTRNNITRGPSDVPKGITIIVCNHLNGHYCEFPFGDVGSKVLSGYGHQQKTGTKSFH